MTLYLCTPLIVVVVKLARLLKSWVGQCKRIFNLNRSGVAWFRRNVFNLLRHTCWVDWYPIHLYSVVFLFILLVLSLLPWAIALLLRPSGSWLSGELDDVAQVSKNLLKNSPFLRRAVLLGCSCSLWQKLGALPTPERQPCHSLKVRRVRQIRTCRWTYPTAGPRWFGPQIWICCSYWIAFISGGQTNDGGESSKAGLPPARLFQNRG